MVFGNWPSCILGQLARGAYVAVAVGVSERWKVTIDRWHVTCNIWHVTCDTWPPPRPFLSLSICFCLFLYVFVFFSLFLSFLSISVCICPFLSVSGQLCLFLYFSASFCILASVLLSTNFKGFSVSRMQTYFFFIIESVCHLWKFHNRRQNRAII